MDAARYAGMSDPDNNPNFRRRWAAPPLKRERPPTGGTVERAENEMGSGLNIDAIFEKFKYVAEVSE